MKLSPVEIMWKIFYPKYPDMTPSPPVSGSRPAIESRRLPSDLLKPFDHKQNEGQTCPQLPFTKRQSMN
jgi:hypothetical protein